LLDDGTRQGVAGADRCENQDLLDRRHFLDKTACIIRLTAETRDLSTAWVKIAMIVAPIFMFWHNPIYRDVTDRWTGDIKMTSISVLSLKA
jgi:hypothetical protein